LDVYADSVLEQRVKSMRRLDKLFVFSPEMAVVC